LKFLRLNLSHISPLLSSEQIHQFFLVSHLLIHLQLLNK
jgi:hypothetical protein